MCHYITGIFSGNVSIESINTIGKDFALKFENCKNGFVQSQLKLGEHYVVKISKYCDCGTLLGSLNTSKADYSQRIEKVEVEKLKKKGWSNLKIERFIADKNKNIQKQASSLEKQRINAVENIKEWTGFINRLFAETPINTFGLLLHWYSRSAESERINIIERKNILNTGLTGTTLLEMEEDELYLIRRK